MIAYRQPLALGRSLLLGTAGTLASLGLGWLGSKPAEGGYVIAARILTAWYFIHFLIILPLLGLIEKPLPLPNSISESVLGKGSGAPPLSKAAASPETRG